MKTDIIELKRMLAGNVEAVCQHLLPGGKREGAEWVYDPGHGKIKIALAGPKAGVWSHFGGDAGGDLIDLWREAKGCDMATALTEVRGYLGVSHPPEPIRQRQAYARPIPVKTVSTPSPAWDYLTRERCLTPETLARYHIGSTPNGQRVVMPFLLPGEQDPALVKVREAKAGARPVPTESGCEPVLLGWHLVGDSRRICIAEGELDAPSGAQLLAGSAFAMPVLSVPFGGGGGNKQAWVENDWSRLEGIEEVWLALDNDREGDLACDEIAKRIGRHKCRRVRLPEKDFNDCLVKGLQAQVLDAFTRSTPMDPVSLRRASDYGDEVQALFHPPEGEHIGYGVPWQRARLVFRPGELTVWSGESGSGKSQLLTALLPHWISYGSVVTVASLEMSGTRTLYRAVKQTAGLEAPTAQYIDRCLDWLGGKNEAGGALLVYDRLGKATVEELLEVFEYARARYGADQFIIDSLMRLGGVSGEDYTAQESAIFELVSWVIEKGVHLHLVAHNRKTQVEGARQGQVGVKGASELVNNAFNQLEVVRMRAVERVREKQEQGYPLSESETEKLSWPGVMVYCNKQRNGDWEGSQALWFDQACYRYYDREDGPNMKTIYCQ